MAGEIRVEGLAGLQRAFRAASKEEAKGLRTSLREAVEPVRADAESLASSGIPRIGLNWSRMRVGVTTRSVYVAPRQRGSRSRRSRPNLAQLLLDRAMLPALDNNREEIVGRVDDMLGHVGRVWETTP